MKKTSLALLVLLSMTAANTAVAFEKGDILVRGGIVNVSPDDSSSDISVGGVNAGVGDIDVLDDTQLMLNASYFFKDDWSVEVLAATPFSHDVDFGTDNALGTGDRLGDLKHLPPTIFVNYHIPTKFDKFHPYVGVGFNYTFFFDEQFSSANRAIGLSDLELDDSLGLAAQIGADYQLNDNLFINVAVRYIDIDTEVTFKLNGTRGEVSTLEVDPWVSSLSIGYRF